MTEFLTTGKKWDLNAVLKMAVSFATSVTTVFPLWGNTSTERQSICQDLSELWRKRIIDSHFSRLLRLQKHVFEQLVRGFVSQEIAWHVIRKKYYPCGKFWRQTSKNNLAKETLSCWTCRIIRNATTIGRSHYTKILFVFFFCFFWNVLRKE